MGQVDWDIRFEQGDLTVLMNIHSKEGRAFVAEAEISDPDTLAAKLDHGYRAWINDSYWLVMPYKLKDTGVTLRYRGLEATQDGRQPTCWSSRSKTSASPHRTNTRSGSTKNRS